MSGANTILSAIRARKLNRGADSPARTQRRRPKAISPKSFAKKLAAQQTDVRMLDSMRDVPDAIADILRGRNMAAEIHIPPDSELAALDLPNVEVRREPPGQFDAAVTFASFAIAETGTLAYAAGKRKSGVVAFPPACSRSPSCAPGAIVAELEDVLAALMAQGRHALDAQSLSADRRAPATSSRRWNSAPTARSRSRCWC